MAVFNYDPFDLDGIYDLYDEYGPSTNNTSKIKGCKYKYGIVQEIIGTFEMKGKDYRLSDRDIISIAQRHPAFRDMPWCPEGIGRLEFRVKNTRGGMCSGSPIKQVELWCRHCNT